MKLIGSFPLLRVALCLALLGAPALHASDITVFAAASLRGALDDMAKLSPDNVSLSYAGSGLIARQVAQGAPADVVVLAHPDWMAWLNQHGHVQPDTITHVTSNTLALIGPHNSAPLDTSLPLQDALRQRLINRRFAMGHRHAVPAGIYAKAWLEHMNLWAEIKPNVVETDNVRLALALVARGDVDLGITYHSDAISDPQVQIVHAIDPKNHPAILYPAAAITPNGRAFVQLLSSAPGQEIFKAHGFK